MNVVIYLRVSSEQQSERQLSIPAQQEALLQYAADHCWNVVEQYLDEARSAKTDERADFQRMIADAQNPEKKFRAILVHKYDRFSRNRSDHVIYKALLKKQGIFVFSATEPLEPDTPHGMLLEGMLEVISEFYNVNLTFETLKGMRENASQGFHCGGRAPYGYRNVRTGSKVNYSSGPEEEVKIIRQIFSLAADGYGGKKIARFLNQQDIPVGRKWSPSTVLSILNNEAYLGHRIWNKKSEVRGHKNPREEWIITENSHPALVDLSLWNTAQARLKVRKVNQ